MYKEIKGDLLKLFAEGEFEVIGHGANCFSTMGAGIAKQIKKVYPDAYYADVYSDFSPIQKLGNITTNEAETIINIYSQFEPGRNLDYEALTLGLRKMRHYYAPNTKIGLPQIGCGIGGGDWSKVKAIIKKELKNMDITIVIYDK
jgi:O-acetyl-ADP-ribose deacetylase (regulator of RNase III)